MTIINIILEILAIAGMVASLVGSYFMYFILKFQKLGRILFIVGFIMMLFVIVTSLIIGYIAG